MPELRVSLLCESTWRGKKKNSDREEVGNQKKITGTNAGEDLFYLSRAYIIHTYFAYIDDLQRLELGKNSRV